MSRLITSKVTVLPTDSKNDNFVLALIDYFNEEFKRNQLKTSKSNGYVKVALDGVYDDKYDCVIVDCCNGKLYLRGGNVKDKYFGRLSKFVANRKSDAYHCVNYNATRIINRIKKLNDSFNNKSLNRLAGKFNGLKNRVRIADLRIFAEEQKTIEEEYKNNATFKNQLNEVFQKVFKDTITSERGKVFLEMFSTSVLLRKSHSEIMNSMGAGGIIQTLANEVGAVIDLKQYKREMGDLFELFNKYIDKDGYDYCTEQLKEILQKQYQDLANKLENQEDKVGEQFDVGKLNVIDILTRECPFVFYNGDIYKGNKGETHNQIMQRMFGEMDNDFFRPNPDDIENLDDNAPLAFGHIINNIAFVEEDELFNCSLNDVIKAVKSQLDVIKVYGINEGSTLMNRLANRVLDLRNHVRVADLRTYKIADLRIDKCIVAEDKKNFYQEYATDKEFHTLIDDIYESVVKEFLMSDDCKEYIKSYTSSQVLRKTLDDALEEANGDWLQLVQNEVKKELDESEYDNVLKDDIEISFKGFVRQNEKMWKQYMNNVVDVSKEKSKDLSEYLSALDDAPGRVIKTTDVDRIDIFNRDKPFLYYNGDILIGNESGTHSEIISDLLGYDSDQFNRKRPNVNKIDDVDKEDSFGFGHIIDNIAFVDDFGMVNCTVDDIGKAVVDETSVDKAYTTPDENESTFRRVAKRVINKLKNLRLKVMK